ncbi:MAG: hypothetical protein E6H74_09285 [Betaproteobacteria bacterium]|nr:MAG: hypothetical protein E6H74_09285 [Betaproteobacteria bacterium]
MNTEVKERSLTTADLAAASEKPTSQREAGPDPKGSAVASDVKEEAEQLAPLFSPDVAKEFRARWDAVQSSFVDDPRQAVRQGDELVASVMKSLAETFSSERAKLESQVSKTDQLSTEDLRIALRRYRSFFERLLSL